MVPELAQLDERRLAHDWTWQQLADDMAERAAVVIAPRTLHYLIKHVEAHARDRTLHKIRKYIATIDAEAANDRRRANRRRRAAAVREARA